jgi:outer membrane biosynthesis protein TonB
VTLDQLVEKTKRPKPSLRRTANDLVKAGLLRKVGDRFLPPECTTTEPPADRKPAPPPEDKPKPKAKKKAAPKAEPKATAKPKKKAKVKPKKAAKPKTNAPEPERADGPDGITFRGRTRPCKKCGAMGFHHCCPQCDATATGIEQVEEVFGFRKLRSKKDGEFRVNQPQCRACRKGGLKKARSAEQAKKAS